MVISLTVVEIASLSSRLAVKPVSFRNFALLKKIIQQLLEVVE